MSLPRFFRVALAGAAVLLAATAGRAQTSEPVTPPSTASPAANDTDVPGRVRVSRIAFTGVSPTVLPELRAALSLRSSSRWPWGRKVYFSRALLAEDLRRIEAYYDAHGSPTPGSTIRVDQPSPTTALSLSRFEGRPVPDRLRAERSGGGAPDVVRQRLMGALGLTLVNPNPGGWISGPGAGRPRFRIRLPYARSPSSNRSQQRRDVDSTIAASRPTAVFGPSRSAAAYVADCHRRQLAFFPGDPFRSVASSRAPAGSWSRVSTSSQRRPHRREHPKEVRFRSAPEGRHNRLKLAVGYARKRRGLNRSRAASTSWGRQTGSVEARVVARSRLQVNLGTRTSSRAAIAPMSRSSNGTPTNPPISCGPAAAAAR